MDMSWTRHSWSRRRALGRGCLHQPGDLAGRRGHRRLPYRFALALVDHATQALGGAIRILRFELSSP
ncbi:hypothetical protein QA811_01010 [Streptomyces sp. B21-102]|uniref:hypothetical protein n=1 Tax=Streptomyces sp. B21-102 TaxID=3039416 RepID=UPI002FF35B40